MTEKMVLSDELLISYEMFAFEPKKYRKKYSKLMKKLHLPYKTNWKQLKAAIQKEPNLRNRFQSAYLTQAMQSGDKNETLVNLASKTSLKIILTDDENAQLPYVYYDSQSITNTLTISFKYQEPRSELITYLESICSDATKVTICDNYFAANWPTTKALFYSVLPLIPLEIEYIETPKTISAVPNSTKMTNQFVQSIFHQWSISQSNIYQNAHDRYLLIESPNSKIEVMLSSGFEYLWNCNKEITCVIRELTKN